ncbi:MAG: sulfatase-like hydrolase/transferase [Planctomycetota bacterium JB042]
MTARADESSSRREFLRGTAAGAAGAVLSQALGCRTAPAERPNLFVIVADDFGIDGVGCYGGEAFDTPRIDALAASGVRFESCYATPLCTPSRVELLTGKYPFRTGWVANIDHRARRDSDGRSRFVDPALGTWAQRLRDAGYRTAVAGKWQLCHFDEHPDHVVECGFDRSCCWAWTVDGKALNRYWHPALRRDGETVLRLEGAYGPDVCCDWLLDFVASSRGRPWVAYHPMILPHKPFVRPPGALPPGKGFDRRKDADAANFPALVGHLDAIVGRVVDALERTGERERTWIVFLGDNGTPAEVATRFRGRDLRGGKGSLTEIGTRVPLIVSRPGVAAPGRVIADPVDLSDLFPTLLDLAGVDVPPGLDGASLAPALRGEGGVARTWAYSQLGAAQSLREGDWKWYSDRRLFDLAGDPFEETNRYDDPAAAEVLRAFERTARELG